MARKPRVFTDTQIYHIILRGNNQQNLFYSDKDYTFFISKLSKYARELNIEIYGYCLMTNHVHILLGKANDVLSLFVQKLANSYVYYFNNKYDRTGHLFQGRFKSEPVNDDIYFKTVLRYILQNPKKIHKNFLKYSWNSYKELFISESSKIITREYVLNLFTTESEAVSFITTNENQKCMEYENKLRFSDEYAINIIKKTFNTKKINQIIRLPSNVQIQKLRTLKSRGLSTNQISRLTGISKGIIKNA